MPPDNLPYVFDGWLLDATSRQRQRLQDSSVEVLAKIHAIVEPESRFAALCPTHTLRQHVDAQRAYYRWALADDGVRIPLIERTFEWLELHWPAEPGPNVLSWGDARIGNIMYQDFEPVAVFDWEMAALGPRELDLGCSSSSTGSSKTSPSWRACRGCRISCAGQTSSAPTKP